MADLGAESFLASPDMEKTERLTVQAAALAAFIVPFMSSAVNVALPVISVELSLGAVSASWLATAFLLPLAALMLPLGRLADIKGRKAVFRIGLIIFSISSALAFMAWNAFFLILIRLGQGVGASMIFSTGMAILATVLPAGRRGRALGFNVAAVYLGLTMGPFIGGVLVRYCGWRYIFVIPALTGIYLAAKVVPKLPDDPPQASGESFDFLGALLLAFALVSTLLGVSLLPGLFAFFLIAAGIILAIVFFFQEKKVSCPLLQVALFRGNRLFAFANLAALIHYSATFAISFLLSIMLQVVRGMTPQQTGLLLVMQPVVQALFSPLAGRLSDRFEARLMAFCGISLTTLGVIGLSALTGKSPLWELLSILALIGFGFALFSSPNTNAIMTSVERHNFGVASATIGTMRVLGQISSMALVTMVFAVKIGALELTAADPDKIMQSVRQAFQIMAFLCLNGAVLSFFAKKKS